MTQSQNAVYIIDPIIPSVLFWTDEVQDILSAVTFANDLYILHGDCRVSRLSFEPIERCIIKLIRAEYWSLSAALLRRFQSVVIPASARRTIPYDAIDRVKYEISRMPHRADELEQLELILLKLETPDPESDFENNNGSPIPLENGMYKVNNKVNDLDLPFMNSDHHESLAELEPNLEENDLENIGNDISVVITPAHSAVMSEEFNEIDLNDEHIIENMINSNEIAVKIRSTEKPIDFTDNIAETRATFEVPGSVKRPNFIDVESKASIVIAPSGSRSPSMKRATSNDSFTSLVLSDAVDNADIPESVRGISRNNSYSSLNGLLIDQSGGVHDSSSSAAPPSDNNVNQTKTRKKKTKKPPKVVELGVPKTAPAHLRGRTTSASIATKPSAEFMPVTSGKILNSKPAAIIEHRRSVTPPPIAEPQPAAIATNRIINLADAQQVAPMSVVTKKTTMKVMSKAKQQTERLLDRVKKTFDPVVDVLKADVFGAQTHIMVYQDGQFKKHRSASIASTSSSHNQQYEQQTYLNSLKLSTSSTRSKLRNHKVVLDAALLRRILEEWVAELHKTLHRYHEDRLEQLLQEAVLVLTARRGKQPSVGGKSVRNDNQNEMEIDEKTNPSESRDSNNVYSGNDKCDLESSDELSSQKNVTTGATSELPSMNDLKPDENLVQSNGDDDDDNNSICICCHRKRVIEERFDAEKIRYLVDPFQMDEGLLADCRFLAELCFSVGVHGNAASQLFNRRKFADVFANCACTCCGVKTNTTDLKNHEISDENASPVNSPKVDSLPVEAPPVNTALVKAPPVKAHVVDTPLVDAPPVDAPLVDAPLVDAPLVDSTLVDTTLVKSTPIKAPPVIAQPVDSPPANAQLIKAPLVNALPVDIPPVRTAPIDALQTTETDNRDSCVNENRQVVESKAKLQEPRVTSIPSIRTKHSESGEIQDFPQLKSTDSKTLDKTYDEDSEIGTFIRCYYFLLDPYKVHKVFSHCSLDNRKQSWNAFVQCLAERHAREMQNTCKILEAWPADETFGLTFIKQLRKHPAILACMKSYFQTNMDKAVKLCVELYPEINAFDVHYMSETSFDRQLPYLPLYLYAAFEKFESRHSFWTELSSNRWLSMRYAELLLRDRYDTELTSTMRCDCGMPRPFSHRSETSVNRDLFALVTSRCVDETVRDLCWRYCRWSMWLRRCTGGSNLVKELQLQVLLQLGDMDLLNAYINKGLMKSKLDWEMLLRFKEMQTKCCDAPEITESSASTSASHSSDVETTARGNTPNDCSETWRCVKCENILESVPCGAKERVNIEEKPLNELAGTNNATPLHNTDDEIVEIDSLFTGSITWEKLARLILFNFDAVVTMEMLTQVDIPRGCLSSDFYRLCFRAEAKNELQGRLSYLLLEQVNTYLWKQHSPQLPSDLMYLIEQEENGNEVSNLLERFEHRCEGRNWDNPETHWGTVGCVSGVCVCCNVELTQRVSDSNSTVSMYPCGHAFHTTCVVDGRVCLLCFK
ncbi:uncharacterized protein LOC141913097 [Tubulanus polymorphus]|uniref:uncharacterized protein LOC141913097 n=1 Tax=Tubulanus polymorphus TaxID=672921 RepID=UPI003DA6C355